MKFNLIGIAGNISRVYEISKIGGFCVKLIPSEAGNVSVNDIELFNEFYGFMDSKNPAMITELCYNPGDVYNLISGREYETLDSINDRINAVKIKWTDIPTTLQKPAQQLFKVAIERLNLGITDCMQIMDVARAIAALEGKEQILTEHLAEAIQYKSVKAN